MTIYDNQVTNRFGVANSRYASGRHTGVDFAGNIGDPIGSAGAGTVVSAGWGGAYGYQVVVRHTDGTYARYAHLSQITVRPGQTVGQGAMVGKVGNTGQSTGPHLHFEIRQGGQWGQPIDPLTWLVSGNVDRLVGSPSEVAPPGERTVIRTTTYTPSEDVEGGMPGQEPVVGSASGSRGSPVVEQEVVGSETGSRGAVGQAPGPEGIGTVGFTEKDVTPASTGGTVSKNAKGLYDLAVRAGFTPDQARIMAAVAMAESGGVATAHNPNASTGDNSYGLWQINMLGRMGPDRRRLFGITRDEDLFDPETNARAAKAIFDQQGFNAWSVYKSGAYRRYL